MRLARRPVTQILGGDILVVDAGVVFHQRGTGVYSEGAFPLFDPTELADEAARCLPGAVLTASLFAPCLDAECRSVGVLLGRLDETGDPMYLPDILIGERPQPGSSPIGILLPGNTSGSRLGTVGGHIVLRPAAYERGPDGDIWDMAAGGAVTFRVTGVHDGTRAGAYLFMQLADLHRLLGVENRVSWAALVYRDPFGIDRAAATLRASLTQTDQALQVLTADDFARMMAADFDRFRRTASFYAVAIVLVSALIVVASSLSSVYSRRRELALLQTVGLAASQVRQLFVCESALVSVVGAGVGYLMSGAVAGMMFRSVVTTPLPALTAVAVTVMVAGASSGSVAAAGVADALRNP